MTHTKYPQACKALSAFMMEATYFNPWIEAAAGYLSPSLAAYKENPVWTADPKRTLFRDVAWRSRTVGGLGSAGEKAASASEPAAQFLCAATHTFDLPNQVRIWQAAILRLVDDDRRRGAVAYAGEPALARIAFGDLEATPIVEDGIIYVPRTSDDQCSHRAKVDRLPNNHPPWALTPPLDLQDFARPAEQLTIEHYNRFPRLGKGAGNVACWPEADDLNDAIGRQLSRVYRTCWPT